MVTTVRSLFETCKNGNKRNVCQSTSLSSSDEILNVLVASLNLPSPDKITLEDDINPLLPLYDVVLDVDGQYYRRIFKLLKMSMEHPDGAILILYFLEFPCAVCSSQACDPDKLDERQRTVFLHLEKTFKRISSDKRLGRWCRNVMAQPTSYHVLVVTAAVRILKGSVELRNENATNAIYICLLKRSDGFDKSFASLFQDFGQVISLPEISLETINIILKLLLVVVISGKGKGHVLLTLRSLAGTPAYNHYCKALQRLEVEAPNDVASRNQRNLFASLFGTHEIVGLQPNLDRKRPAKENPTTVKSSLGPVPHEIKVMEVVPQDEVQTVTVPTSETTNTVNKTQNIHRGSSTTNGVHPATLATTITTPTTSASSSSRSDDRDYHHRKIMPNQNHRSGKKIIEQRSAAHDGHHHHLPLPPPPPCLPPPPLPIIHPPDMLLPTSTLPVRRQDYDLPKFITTTTTTTTTTAMIAARKKQRCLPSAFLKQSEKIETEWIDAGQDCDYYIFGNSSSRSSSNNQNNHNDVDDDEIDSIIVQFHDPMIKSLFHELRIDAIEEPHNVLHLYCHIMAYLGKEKRKELLLSGRARRRRRQRIIVEDDDDDDDEGEKHNHHHRRRHGGKSRFIDVRLREQLQEEYGVDPLEVDDPMSSLMLAWIQQEMREALKGTRRRSRNNGHVFSNNDGYDDDDDDDDHEDDDVYRFYHYGSGDSDNDNGSRHTNYNYHHTGNHFDEYLHDILFAVDEKSMRMLVASSFILACSLFYRTMFGKSY